MKKLYLYQALMTPAGCIGKLLVEGEEFFSLETQKCLEEGEHKLIHTLNGFRIDGDYRVCMDANGLYRNDGLVIGMSVAPRAFDMHRKGAAIQRLFELVGREECLLIVRNTSKLFVIDAEPEPLVDKVEKVDGRKDSTKAD